MASYFYDWFLVLKDAGGKTLGGEMFGVRSPYNADSEVSSEGLGYTDFIAIFADLLREPWSDWKWDPVLCETFWTRLDRL
jgi:hypothetical protein